MLLQFLHPFSFVFLPTSRDIGGRVAQATPALESLCHRWYIAGPLGPCALPLGVHCCDVHAVNMTRHRLSRNKRMATVYACYDYHGLPRAFCREAWLPWNLDQHHMSYASLPRARWFLHLRRLLLGSNVYQHVKGRG